MSKLEKRIHDEKNGLDYVLVGDYYIPALIFPEGRRHIGKWGRMHRAYLKEHHPNRYNATKSRPATEVGRLFSVYSEQLE